MSARRPSTTCIGSLPHHNVDAALEFSFRTGIPFLPQIPVRNPWEYMLPQALENLPGLLSESDGAIRLNAEVWQSRRSEFEKRLQAAFEKKGEALEPFEPGPSTSSAWQPFVWELSERKIAIAKVQIAGPLTCQWSLTYAGEASQETKTEISAAIFKLVLARSLAMVRRLKSQGIQPILYLDEPALYGLSMANARHAMGLQELRLMVQTLRKEGSVVGLHCCSNTDWSAVLALGVDFLSIDVELSLQSLLERTQALEAHLASGGRLSLGVIPTARSSVLHSLDVAALFAKMLEAFGRSELGAKKPELVRKLLSEAVFTPACGLALHSTADSEIVLGALIEFEERCHRSLQGVTRQSRPSSAGVH
ncbi:MAG TPA: hypothetical protein VM598_09270 [Bdellovibrionota bacterium]|nr:hypothetical protein [Bdellovibrionota bacterium]